MQYLLVNMKRVCNRSVHFNALYTTTTTTTTSQREENTIKYLTYESPLSGHLPYLTWWSDISYNDRIQGQLSANRQQLLLTL